MKRILAAVLALILTTTLFSAALAEASVERATPSGIPYDGIQSRVDAYIAEREAGLASCAVSVFDADSEIFTGCYGFSDIGNGVRADGETVYEWGSSSKLLVWVAAMQLWERGLLDLEADIRSYLPEGFLTKLQKEIVRLLKIYLETDGVAVFEANDGTRALELLDSRDIDLALVDIMMPKVDGYQVIRDIRRRERYIPVIVISAKVTLSERVLGIDLGADDYVTKPFEPLEVAAKVRAQLRRLNTAAPLSRPARVLSAGGVTLDLDACSAIIGGETVELTKAEFKVLELLISQPRRVFTKEQIYGSAWYDDGAVDDNTIRVIISRLRDKIGAGHIRTIRGLGYRFEE